MAGGTWMSQNKVQPGVYINTKSMKNRDKAEDLNARAERLIEEGTARADRIYAGVLEQLK